VNFLRAAFGGKKSFVGPVFWLMISEVFPLRIRSPAMATSTVANRSANFVISFTFLSLVGLISRAGAFWLYAALGVVAMVVFHRTVPETKGRSLEEIELELGAGTAAGGLHPAGAPR